jgi:hypothetical protein
VKRLPDSVFAFVRDQTTQVVSPPAESPEEEYSPYGSWWYRAVAGLLLAGRVSPKMDDNPNRTEINRICKEAHFNQYLFERVARFLSAAGVVRNELEGSYLAGPNHAAFWDQDTPKLQKAAQRAVLRVVEKETGYQPKRPTKVENSHLIEFLALFFACFKDLSLREADLGRVFHDFSTLPSEDLTKAAQALGIKGNAHQCGNWRHWLAAKGQAALTTAVGIAEWAFWDRQDKTIWISASATGLGVLGLEPMPVMPSLTQEFRALANHRIFAGARLAVDKLVPLFRYCVIKRLDQVYEFQVTSKRLAEVPASKSPGKDLHKVLAELEPLPATLEDLLGTKSQLGGEIGIRWCRA